MIRLSTPAWYVRAAAWVIVLIASVGEVNAYNDNQIVVFGVGMFVATLISLMGMVDCLEAMEAGK